MKHRISYVAIALAMSLSASAKPALAQIVPQAKTSDGPAVTTFGVNTLMAWAGNSSETQDGQTIHKLGYKLHDLASGTWQGQQIMPYKAINTTAAPALATAEAQGDGINYAYMAWGQGDGLMHYAVWDYSANGFSTTDPAVCDTTLCQTIASPALAGDGSTVYAAWTRPSNLVHYASYSGGAWTVYSAALPNALSTVAPAIAAHGTDLYIAWVAEDASVQVEHTPLPLSSTSVWTTLPALPSLTAVAPSLLHRRRQPQAPYLASSCLEQ